LTPARFLIRKLGLNEVFSDSQIRSMADAIVKEYFSGKTKIRIDIGAKITENYRNGIGGGSCMTGSYADCTRLYEMNPDRFAQAIATYNNDSARAILATLDNGHKMLCRIYSTSNYVHQILEEHGKKNDWSYPKNDEDVIMSDLKYKDGCVPYMDNFSYYKLHKGKMTIFESGNNYFESGNNYDGSLDHTDGYMHHNVYCNSCDEPVTEDDLYRIGDEPYCHACVTEHFRLCEECNLYVTTDEIFIIEDVYICETCSGSVADECENCGDLFFDESLRETEDGPVCGDCLRENYTSCTECGVLAHTDTIEDGICESCEMEMTHEEEESN
jgi:hypothetical protein